MVMKKILVLILFLLLLPLAEAASISYSQAGADAGTVMKGVPFTVTVSGLSGSGTVTLNLPTGFSTSEATTKSFSSGTSSVSWTTVTANAKLTGQTISATIQTTGSPTTVTTNSFNVVLPPSLSATVSPSSVSVQQGSSFSLSLNVQNSGETTARFGTITVSPSDFSISTGCSPSDVSPSGNSGISCTISVSSSAATGTRTLTLSINPTNADPITKTVSVAVSAAPSEEKAAPSTAAGGISKNVTAEENVTVEKIKKPELVPGIGIRNNTKLQSAVEKVLAKGKLSQQALENLERLSASITSDIDTTRKFSVTENKSAITNVFKYKGTKKVKNFIVFDNIPKEFAASADQIKVETTGTAEVVEKDPSYAILFPELSPQQEVSVKYSVDGKVSETVLDAVGTELYAEALEEVKEEKPVEKPFDTTLIIILLAIIILIGIVLFAKFRKR